METLVQPNSHFKQKVTMKNLLIAITAVFFIANGQATAQTAEQLMMQQQFFNHYGKIYQKGVKSTDLTGPKYLYDEWREIFLKTKDFEVTLSAVKINLYETVLEVFYQGEEKIIFAKDFQYFIISENGEERKFIPAHGYTYSGKMLEGFMEVAGEDEKQVLVQHYTGIKEPGPSANIVGGPTGNVLVKSSKTYIFSKGKLTQVKNKKQFAQYFNEKSKLAEKLMKEKKTDFKKPVQLYEIMELVQG